MCRTDRLIVHFAEPVLRSTATVGVELFTLRRGLQLSAEMATNGVSGSPRETDSRIHK